MLREPDSPLTITFTIPYYRGLDYLRRAIQSVFGQSTPNWRLQVIDDGSEEPAEHVVGEFGDPRVAYLRNERTLGMAGNWNRCLDVAQTDLVTILHADDELLPNYAHLMTSAAVEDMQACAFFCRANVIDGRGRRTFSFPDRIKDVLAGWSNRPLRLAGPNGIARLLRGCFVMCPTVCYRKSQLGPRRFSGRWKMVLDLEFFSRLLTEGEELIGLPTVAYSYRRHANHATAAYNENLLRFHEEAALYDEIAASARNRGWFDVARVGNAKNIVKLHLLFRTLAALAAGRIGAARDRFVLLGELCSRGKRRERPCVWR